MRQEWQTRRPVAKCRQHGSRFYRRCMPREVFEEHFSDKVHATPLLLAVIQENGDTDRVRTRRQLSGLHVLDIHDVIEQRKVPPSDDIPRKALVRSLQAPCPQIQSIFRASQ